MGHVAVVGEFWSGRSVLVTGAGGLLGSWAARTLAAAGAQVVGLDVAGGQWGVLADEDPVARVRGDVRDRDLLQGLLADRAVDTVVHLAAQAVVGIADQDPVETFEHNVRGTWQLLEACRRHGRIRALVVASSDKAYGDAGGVPYSEDTPLRGRFPYDVSKACADLLAQSYAHSYGLPVVVTRCGNLFGGGDLHWSRIVPGTIRSVLEGSSPVIRSDGTMVRDYLYVEDALAGVLLAARAAGERPDAAGRAYNLAGEHRLSVLGIVDRILAVMESDMEPEVRAEAHNEIPEQRVSSARAAAELGWRPVHPLDEALAGTVAWYRRHLAAVPR